jgi:hypothetical protein
MTTYNSSTFTIVALNVQIKPPFQEQQFPVPASIIILSLCLRGTRVDRLSPPPRSEVLLAVVARRGIRDLGSP